jgi:hypothetical protein
MRTSKRRGGGRRTTRRPENARPRLVACIGLKSSGSTWLYNVLAELLKAEQARKLKRSALRRGGCGSVMQFYADSVESFPVAAEDASHIVVKAHIPSRSLSFLLHYDRTALFLTVRDPRDSITSLLQRFGHRFDDALREIGQGSEWLAHFANTHNPPVFRYEEKFYEHVETVEAIAKLLDLRLPRATLKRVFETHTSDAVKRRIRALENKGAFGKTPHPDNFHPTSHWHPGHVGDLAIGKYAEFLSVKQQRAVLGATRAFCLAFGYGDPSSRPRPTKGSNPRKKTALDGYER